MTLPPIIAQLEQRLSGWPDKALTLLLVVLALLILIAAFNAPTTLKAIIAAWVIAP